MSQRDPCRFCRLFAIAAPAIALVMGLWTSLQALLDPSAAQKGHLVWGTLVRATAPAASGSAVLLALLLWAHPLRPAALQQDLPRILRRAALVALPGYLVAAGVALLAGLTLGDRETFALAPADFALGGAFAAVDSALLVALSWRFLPRLSHWPLSLPAKLSLALAVTVPLRATVALLAANVLSP
ncbi:MAG: hypothetical protein EOO73_20990 [Myxococcales bacterium]|nr:MAG: hypothetical protein EOO73_20990 [Myxococcales bacterium]